MKVRRVLAALILGACLLPGRAQACETGEYVRLHVVASSDSAQDQALKLWVRDGVRAVSAALLRGNSRKKEIAIARHVAVYLTREMTNMSLPRIGDAFSRDHSTIINSCDKVTQLLESSTQMKSAIADLKKIITEK